MSLYDVVKRMNKDIQNKEPEEEIIKSKRHTPLAPSKLSYLELRKINNDYYSKTPNHIRYAIQEFRKKSSIQWRWQERDFLRYSTEEEIRQWAKSRISFGWVNQEDLDELLHILKVWRQELNKG